MTDPLGQSQVIPYMIGLTNIGYKISILSFEKNDRFKKSHIEIENKFKANNIKWYPKKFSKNFKILSKVKDIVILKLTAKKLNSINNYDIIHARSYLAADIGFSICKSSNAKLLFDIRGFWPDEKAEGGNWNISNFFWKQVYKYYKNLEKKLFRYSDHIICLTQNGKNEICSWEFYNSHIPISVIPCCSDENKFTLTNENSKLEAKKILGISSEKFTLGYLGSVGSWYMLVEMLQYFKLLKLENPASHFLFITNSDKSIIHTEAMKQNINISDITIKTVSHPDVPKYMKASDMSICFIKDVYSKKASSPTKIGEILNMGIPIVINDIGDARIISENCSGVQLLNYFDENSIIESFKNNSSFLNINPLDIRNKSIEFYSLDKGLAKYNKAYLDLSKA